MTPPTQQSSPNREIWRLVARQHGVVTRAQLVASGYTGEAIRHRVRTGRLHPAGRSVYAVGRPNLGQHGRVLAAVLSCGAGSMAMRRSAAALYGIEGAAEGPIEVATSGAAPRPIPGITVHRRAGSIQLDRRVVANVPVTGPVCTLIDLASVLSAPELERAVNDADRLELVRFDSLRSALGGIGRQRGIAALRHLIDRLTFVLTRSELERRFLPIAARAGLSGPETEVMVNGFEVDFWWPRIGLVVETDGLRYHRTPAQQARDRIRDQTHAAAGLTPLRFTHAQVRFKPEYVTRILSAVAARLTKAAGRHLAQQRTARLPASS